MTNQILCYSPFHMFNFFSLRIEYLSLVSYIEINSPSLKSYCISCLMPVNISILMFVMFLMYGCKSSSVQVQKSVVFIIEHIFVQIIKISLNNSYQIPYFSTLVILFTGNSYFPTQSNCYNLRLSCCNMKQVVLLSCCNMKQVVSISCCNMKQVVPLSCCNMKQVVSLSCCNMKQVVSLSCCNMKQVVSLSCCTMKQVVSLACCNIKQMFHYLAVI